MNFVNHFKIDNERLLDYFNLSNGKNPYVHPELRLIDDYIYYESVMKFLVAEEKYIDIASKFNKVSLIDYKFAK